MTDGIANRATDPYGASIRCGSRSALGSTSGSRRSTGPSRRSLVSILRHYAQGPAARARPQRPGCERFPSGTLTK
jgi:hypothetical protein